MTNYGKEQDSYIYVGKAVLPDNVAYKRGNIFLIILGYVMAVFAGVIGVQGVHDMLYNIVGGVYLGLVPRIICVIGILSIYAALRLSLAYLCAMERTPDKQGGGFYKHPKYDAFTRVNALLMLVVLSVVAVCFGITLHW